MTDFVAVDWGTSSFRAYLVKSAQVTAEHEAARGILTVEPGQHAGVLRTLIGFLPSEAAGLPIVMSGMIGSRQGWKEAPYASVPATLADIVQGALRWREPGLGPIALLPGVMQDPPGGMPDVMRGEETQIFGALDLLGLSEGTFIMPGTHSKAVAVSDSALKGFRSFMTGEVFAALKGHTILGRLMEDGQPNGEGFARGVAASRSVSSAGGLLNAIFGARTLGLFKRLPPPELGEYLSGLLIGAELCEALPEDGEAVVVGSDELCDRYVRAADQLGRGLRRAPERSVVAGQIAAFALLAPQEA